ncbi:MAG: DUF4234 domain-containing protein [Clostridia bacterium]|nr:DUF4234 domain-containing protein [Clostridia bacterium]
MSNCPNCNAVIDDNAAFCTSCGTKIEAPVQQAQQPVQQAQQPNIVINNTTAAASFAGRPALQLATNRGMLKMIFFTLITFGIYAMVVWNRMAAELDIVASRYDGKRTCPYFAMVFLTPFTLGIYTFVWIHGFCNRLGTEVKRRGYNYNFSASDFWLWGMLGSLIFIGPFVYLHKLTKSMNMVNASYNLYG